MTARGMIVCERDGLPCEIHWETYRGVAVSVEISDATSEEFDAIWKDVRAMVDRDIDQESTKDKRR